MSFLRITVLDWGICAFFFRKKTYVKPETMLIETMLSEDPISANRTALKPKLFKLLPLALVSPHSLKSGGILIIGQKQDSLDSSDKVIQKNRSFPNLDLDASAYVSGVLVWLI